jgi:hypothetical protein
VEDEVLTNHDSKMIEQIAQICIKQPVLIVARFVKYLSSLPEVNLCIVEIVSAIKKDQVPDHLITDLLEEVMQMIDKCLTRFAQIVVKIAKSHSDRLQDEIYFVQIVLKRMKNLVLLDPPPHLISHDSIVNHLHLA